MGRMYETEYGAGHDTGYVAGYEFEHDAGGETGFEARYEAAYETEREFRSGVPQTYDTPESAYHPDRAAETYQLENDGRPTAQAAAEAAHSREDHPHRAVYGISIPPTASQATSAQATSAHLASARATSAHPGAPRPHTPPNSVPGPLGAPPQFNTPTQYFTPSTGSSPQPQQPTFASAAFPDAGSQAAFGLGTDTGSRAAFGLGPLPSSRTFSASELYPADLRPMLTRHRLRRRRHRTAASMLTGAALAFGVSALRPWSAFTPGSPASARGPTNPSAQARMPAIPVTPVTRPVAAPPTSLAEPSRRTDPPRHARDTRPPNNAQALENLEMRLNFPYLPPGPAPFEARSRFESRQTPMRYRRPRDFWAQHPRGE